MNLTIPLAGKLACLSIFFAVLLLISWTVVVVNTTKQYSKSSTSDLSRYNYNDHIDMTKLPKLSADKRTLVVSSEEGLPTAFEFLRLNMYLPIQKIVLMKSGSVKGANDTVRVYPIPRDGMIGLSGSNLPLSFPEIGLVVLFILFIVGSFACIFSSMNGARAYWDEEGWLLHEDSCTDATELSCDDDLEDENILVKAEKKRREIEEI